MSKYFEVVKILAVRSIDGRKEYRVRWKGFGSKDDAWVPDFILNFDMSAGARARFFGVTINYFVFNEGYYYLKRRDRF